MNGFCPECGRLLGDFDGRMLDNWPCDTIICQDCMKYVIPTKERKRKKLELEGIFEYENAGNGYYFSWVTINGSNLAQLIFKELPETFKGKMIIEVYNEEKTKD